MKKGIWVMSIIAAFVAGTIITNFAEAKNENNPDPIAAAIDRLTSVMEQRAVQGPQGDQGPQGEQGPPGDPQLFGDKVYTVTRQLTLEQDDVFQEFVDCEEGDLILGASSISNNERITLILDGPFDSDSWVYGGTTAKEFFPGVTSFPVSIRCLDITP